MPSRSANPGLYLHVPFCSAICPYCDFAVTRGGSERRAAYVDAAIAEVALAAGWWREARPFDTVYLGGGTPSMLAAEELARLLSALRSHLPVAPEARLFLEANPEDASPEKLAELREIGVSTLSLGVQSFDPGALKLLGRRHTPEAARRAVAAALEAGFATVSVDLIFGLPHLGAERYPSSGALEKTLATTVAIAPHHLSCYQLTFHQGTPFGRGLARGVIRVLPEPAQAAAYEQVLELLAAAGYEPYEVSNFARATPDGADHRSAHNRKYWDHTPYLGLGPSAHSFDGRRRWWNERGEEAWRRRLAAGERPVAGEETLSDADLALEALMLGLRTAAGVDLERFRERFGVDLVARNEALVERLVEEGLVAVAAGRLRPTLRGFAVADGLPVGFETTPSP
ncbi:MAG TPA: radical SAM family heme chaperone HemW [Thermoanaerobaculia bacterium]|nr:radical SAM family heme chaperone HemW [Thermoanaerobaculia bacterium]